MGNPFKWIITEVESGWAWTKNHIEDIEPEMIKLFMLSAKFVGAPLVVKATAYAEQQLNLRAQAAGTTLVTLALTEAEHITVVQDVIAAIKVFAPNIGIPDAHALAAQAVNWAMKGITFVEQEIGQAETAAGITS
jgi:hypothetical protein